MHTEQEIKELVIKIEKLYRGLRKIGFTSPDILAHHINTLILAEHVAKGVLEQAWDEFYRRASEKGFEIG